MSSQYYWPKQSTEVHQFCKTCHPCQVAKQSRTIDPGTGYFEVPDKRFSNGKYNKSPSSKSILKSTSIYQTKRNISIGYWSLLYILKNSLPEIKNSVRELSKNMVLVYKEVYKHLLIVLNLIKYTSNLVIIFKSYETLTWNLIFY